VYITKGIISFADCDFVGVLFYGKIFELVHKVFEEYLESQNYYKDYFRNSEIIYPIIHCDATYVKPLSAGDIVTYILKLKTIRASSFELEYDILKEGDELAASVNSVHLAILKTVGGKIEIPSVLRDQLETLKCEK